MKLPLMLKKHYRFPSSYHDRKSRKSLRSGVCFKLIAFLFLFGRTNIETSQLFFRDVFPLVASANVPADLEASRTQKIASDTQVTSKEDRHRISELLSDRHVSFLPRQPRFKYLSSF